MITIKLLIILKLSPYLQHPCLFVKKLATMKSSARLNSVNDNENTDIGANKEHDTN